MASPHHASARRIEQRSLHFGVGANVVMTLAGFSAHVLTGSNALLLDGLYSAVLVGSSLIASRISRNVVRPPDWAWPCGYKGAGSRYVLFRYPALLGCDRSPGRHLYRRGDGPVATLAWRHAIDTCCRAELRRSVRLEVILRLNSPSHHLHPTSQAAP